MFMNDIIFVFFRGNILLARKESQFAELSIKGKRMRIKTSGLEVAIIDFTLSRINTGYILASFSL